MVLVIPEHIWTICSVAEQAALCTNGVASFQIVPRSPVYLLSARFLLYGKGVPLCPETGTSRDILFIHSANIYLCASCLPSAGERVRNVVPAPQEPLQGAWCSVVTQVNV